MVSVKGVMMGVILVVIGLALTPTIWTTTYDAIEDSGVNGSTRTLLELVPLIYVGAVLIGSVLLARYG